MIVAADSGPLISLASVFLLDLLYSLFGTIHIPNGAFYLSAANYRKSSDSPTKIDEVANYAIYLRAG